MIYNKIVTEKFILGCLVMSLNYYEFEKESGITGFLGGIVSSAADEFSMKLYNLGINHETFEADIFYIGENNKVTFENSIKKRMRESWYGASTEGDETDIEELIDSSHFKFIQQDKTTLANVITNMYGVNFIGVPDIARKFERDIEYYIQKPKAIYSLPFEFNKEIYECYSIMSRCYAYSIWDVKLVEYDEYALLLVRGCDE